MTAPTIDPDDTNPALDLRVITPSTEYLNPRPRAMYFGTGGGILVMEVGDPVPPFEVSGLGLLAIRPTRILPGTTATVVALY